ncbi:hypothetical protein [Helicobacter sp.]|uniref:hypothetical protein n=1 Tax=Helicobacter sp. TaxID=218 RepID=UPI0025BA2457|nr:hypothetical protein [Helicobacter sp.]MBR2495011.1 hypothetical protein [Helicobacter sp.]
MTENDLKVEEWIDSFTKMFRMLQPKDRDIYLKKLMEAVENAKKTQMEEDIAKENPANDFIDTIAQSAAELENQIQTQELMDTLSEAIDEVAQENDSNIEATQLESTQTQEQISPPPTQVQEDQELSDKEFERELEKGGFVPLEKLDFYRTLQDAIDEFIESHKEELLELGIISTDTEMGIGALYDRDIILPKEEIDKLEKQYNKDPQNFNPTISFEEVKNRRIEHNNFNNIYLDEIAQSLGEQSNNKSLDEVKKLNPDSYFSDIMDWFKKKQIENMNMPMSKDTFKKEFYDYCKNGMSENEMKILLILDNKEPTKLTKEHKDMIKEGLKLCTANNKLLDKGLESAVRASVGEKLTNANALEFSKTLEKAKASKTTIDKKFIEPATSQKLIDTIKAATPKLTQENARNLDDTLLAIQGKSNTKSNNLTKTL